MKIRVPATSANLGPGFDCLGLALNLYNELEIEKSDGKSTLVDEVSNIKIENNLIFKTYKETFKYYNKDLIDVNIKSKSNIPQSRGLGSSSACIVAGIVAAFCMMQKDLDRQEILELANKIEGHPDNVAPCVNGGITISSILDDKLLSVKIDAKNEYKFLALVPDFKLSTKKARDVMPKEISLKDGIFNTSRVAILVASLINGYDSNLKYGFEDKFHQDYRKKLINNYDDIMKFLEEKKVLGKFISGAGSTILALVKKDDCKTQKEIEEFLRALKDKWQVLELELDKNGFECIY